MNDRMPLDITLALPRWVRAFVAKVSGPFETDEARMGLVVSLARENVERETGGPFAAAVFAGRPARLLAVGVNVVVRARCSAAHAEMVALALAQQAAQTHDLGAAAGAPCELVTSTEPCAMCLGAVPWSGVRQLVCGALDTDARAIGFDEGSKPEDWQGELRKRGISVMTGVCREEAIRCLEEYKQHGGIIYNATRT